MLAAATVFVSAYLTSVLLTLLVRKAAPCLGLIDRPDGRRKLHGQATPLGGGAAIFLSLAIVLLALLIVPNPWQAYFRQTHDELFALLLAGAVIATVGLIDDRVRLRGRLKMVGQIAAASVLMYSGLMIQRVALFGYEIDLGLLAIPFTLFWFLGAVNAVNLMDGIDGLATMVGFILISTIGAMALITGHSDIVIIALVFAGSLLGFLRFNFPPASIFLGDAGSMLIGLVVGALAIRGSLKGPGTVLLAAPLAVWTIPIFDSSIAILRRKLTGRSIYTTDRGHLHHRLLDLLGSNRKVLATLAVCCALTSAAAMVSLALRSDLLAILACSAIVIILVATGVFGRAELALLSTRLRRFGQSLWEPTDSNHTRIRQSAVRLQGSQPWELLWTMLTDSAEQLGLSEIRLDLNVPQAQEGYHASWEWSSPDGSEHRWRMEIPLIADNQLCGGLTVVGQRKGKSACEDIERLLSLLEPFEMQLLLLAEQKVPVPVADSGLAAGQKRNSPSSSILARRHPK